MKKAGGAPAGLFLPSRLRQMTITFVPVPTRE